MATSSRTPRIFISHNRKDNDFGVQLVDDLRQIIGDESAVWYDSRGGLNGGDIWWKKIKKELKRRNTFIVILSPNSLKSPWVEKEIDIAWQRHVHGKMKIIPVLYQLCRVPEDLQTIHTISFLSDRVYEEALQELKVALRLPKDFMGAENVSSFGDYRKDKMQQLVREVEVAYYKDDWSCVIKKVDAIAHQYPEAIPPSLYRMQGWAYYFENQPSLAQNALEKEIKLMQDPQKQLTLSDAYTAQLVSNGQWNEVLARADEALRLDPRNPIWHMAKDDALERVHQDGHIFLEQAVPHFPDKDDVTKAQIESIAPESRKDNAAFASADKQNIRLTGNVSKESAPDQKLEEVELQKQKLSLQKERFYLEKEIVNFAFEIAERMVDVSTDENSSTKARLIRTFLPPFLSLEDEKGN